MTPMDSQAVIDATRRWVETMVIGLNLCPFARRVVQGDKVRHVVSAATDEESLYQDLGRELQHLATAPIATVETTLLIHPGVLTDFLDFNDFLDPADRLVRRLGLDGVIQIASFHPDYQFADTAADDVANYTNRSPYPMLHLLREESITRVAGDPEELAAIPERNVATLRRLGLDEIRRRLGQGPIS